MGDADMRSFTNLLVYAPNMSRSPAVVYATRLAAASGANVTLADAIEQIPAAVERQLPEPWDAPKPARDWRKAGLGRAAARVRRAGVQPSIVIFNGASVNALVREMSAGNHDLLIVDAPREPAVRAADAIIARLVRDCPCPMLLARAPVRRRPRILVAIDASLWRAREADSLSVELTESALWLADQLDGEVHVLHAWESLAEGSMRWAGVSPGTLREYHLAGRRAALEELEHAIEPLRDRITAPRVHVEAGDPRTVIPAFAALNRVDLIVIGTVARSGLGGRIIGNTAEAVLDDLPCSMLVMRREYPQSHRDDTWLASRDSDNAS
jgi:universal stress protein E